MAYESFLQTGCPTSRSHIFESGRTCQTKEARFVEADSARTHAVRGRSLSFSMALAAPGMSASVQVATVSVSDVTSCEPLRGGRSMRGAVRRGVGPRRRSPQSPHAWHQHASSRIHRLCRAESGVDRMVAELLNCEKNGGDLDLFSVRVDFFLPT